jgi:hypothetical protein
MSEGSSNYESRARGLLWRLGANVLILAVTLILTELALQWLDFAYLRMGGLSALGYQHDPELGWSPTPNSTIVTSLPRIMTVQHNSLGLRDVELDERDSRPGVLFLGDSFVWGYNVEEHERFTDLLRRELPEYRIVNAGVSGYGTDQEYLLMRRIWDAIKPTVVVLMFCVENDRADNSSNLRYFSYKPYLRRTDDRNWEFAGQPPPKERHARLKESYLAQKFMLARLAISAYVEIRYRRITVPDPTEQLIGMIREFVEAKGARMVVGVQRDEPQLEAFLQSRGIPHVSFEGAGFYDSSKHWTPSGNEFVARRLLTLFSETGISSVARPQTQTGLNP